MFIRVPVIEWCRCKASEHEPGIDELPRCHVHLNDRSSVGADMVKSDGLHCSCTGAETRDLDGDELSTVE